TSFVVMSFLHFAGGLRSAAAIFLTSAAVLMANQAPWLASWLMPDILAGLGCAAIAVLILRPRPMGLAIQLGLAALALFGAVAAVANMILFSGLAVFCLLLRWIVLRNAQILAPTLGVIGAILLAGGVTIAANWRLQGHATLNASSAGLTFARLADVNIAQPYLRETCPQKRYPICDKLDRLENPVRGKQNFLWDGVADETDAWHDPNGDYAVLTHDLMLARPWAFVREGLRDLTMLAAEPTLGESATYELGSFAGDNYVRAQMRALHPKALAAFDNARQQRGDLTPLFPKAAFTASTYVGYLALAILGAHAFWRRDRIGGCLALAGLAFIAAELLLHAMLVGAFPRYHVKVAWIGWLFTAALLARGRTSARLA
ncbi:hypothetical protein, partial [Phenylobacterium sp.]|uniref:hypothetical protein n=1 Tax=Phenylobacterium sp. TaxID=1871053 RepID=UPI002F405237